MTPLVICQVYALAVDAYAIAFPARFKCHCVTEGLMGPDLVVDVLPTEKIGPQAGDGPVQVVDLVELLPVGAVAALNTAVELR